MFLGELYKCSLSRFEFIKVKLFVVVVIVVVVVVVVVIRGVSVYIVSIMRFIVS